MSDRPHRTLVLASRSPRRAALLRQAGYPFLVVESDFVDPPHPETPRDSRIDPAEVAIRLAIAKANATRLPSAIASDALILAADTLCIGADGSLIGQPSDVEEARAIIRSFTARRHDVVTGVAILDVNNDHRIESFAATAAVYLGELKDVHLEAYLRTGRWRGKAGGYNLLEVQQEHWPIRVEGDPTTVIGLPMDELRSRLEHWELRPIP